MAELQKINSIGNDIYNAYYYYDAKYEPHFHKAYELICVIDGELFCTIENKDYLVKKGESLFVLPFQLHSFNCKDSCEYLVIVFSDSFVPHFARMIAGKTIENAKFSLDEITNLMVFNKLASSKVASKRILPVGSCLFSPKPDNLTLKSTLYAVCQNAFYSFNWVDQKRNDELVYAMLNYIDERFYEDITLYTMSNALGYDYRYLSRVFSTAFSIPFRTLVNQYRCDYAYFLITTTNETLSNIAMKSGFQCIRSFNRAFKEILGITPSSLLEK